MPRKQENNMPRKGYKQTEHHRKKHLEQISGEGNGKWKGGVSNDKIYRSQTRIKSDKKYILAKRYGITIEVLEALILAQGGKCKICSSTTKRMHIDHDHITGRVRGLLCSRCNMGLGLFLDNPKFLQEAIRYLKTINGT